MPTETLNLMVEGGKVSPNPVTAQKLGPLGINIGEVMNQVNEKTKDFVGMQVPVKLTIDTTTKAVTNIEVGTPPTSQLIKKGLGLDKGAGQPDKEKVGNISIEQCIKVALMKKDAMYVTSLKAAVKSVVGSCNALGVLVEGKSSHEVSEKIDQGKYVKEIQEEKTEPSEEKKKKLSEQLEKVKESLAEELAKIKAAEKEKEGKKEEKAEEGKEGEEKEGDKKEEKKEEGKKEEKKGDKK